MARSFLSSSKNSSDPMSEQQQSEGSISAGDRIIHHNPPAGRQVFRPPCGKWLYHVEDSEKHKACQKPLPTAVGAGHENKHLSGNFINHNLAGIVHVEESFRLSR